MAKLGENVTCCTTSAAQRSSRMTQSDSKTRSTTCTLKSGTKPAHHGKIGYLNSRNPRSKDIGSLHWISLPYHAWKQLAWSNVHVVNLDWLIPSLHAWPKVYQSSCLLEVSCVLIWMTPYKNRVIDQWHSHLGIPGICSNPTILKLNCFWLGPYFKTSILEILPLVSTL